MSDKIKIAISSCLLGYPVRYDGGHRLDPYLRDNLGQLVEWVPVCPEVECGLPVPREPMLIIDDGKSRRLVAMSTGIDHTVRLLMWTKKKLADLEKLDLRGFVFKARSPSCAVRDAQIVTPSGSAAGKGAGLFAEAVLRSFPSLPVHDEETLQDPAVIGGFIESICAPGRGQIDFQED
jgi:uncharacterized protein YbbK (DUF523 family)